ncbi:hypothetical protein ONE63_003379 [Megalurothrips usitatus]|uniref:Uncharacterized protein n=1 Tax=Megalurothrips usitatus TaxID=439358 RepID=A0AAV7X739_9NEOP|nr:hypothetical protein ONE63_003379 [Megalurothrips usitatus]
MSLFKLVSRQPPHLTAAPPVAKPRTARMETSKGLSPDLCVSNGNRTSDGHLKRPPGTKQHRNNPMNTWVSGCPLGPLGIVMATHRSCYLEVLETSRSIHAATS